MDLIKEFKARIGFAGKFNSVPAPYIKDQRPSADYLSGGQYRVLFTHTFNGEKNLGEMGPAKNYLIDYAVLRTRAWQSYLESEITQTVIGKHAKWTIGEGLKLQCEPSKVVLQAEGVDFESNRQEFCKNVEARFDLFRLSKESDYSQMENLDELAKTAYINSIVGGDVLVVLRYDDSGVSIQLVDAQHVQSPAFGSEIYPQNLANGHTIQHGIELDARRKHIAYYVRSNNALDPFKIVRVPAIGAESGLEMAFMVYGLKYRIDNVRGLPVIAVVLETLKKLERYKEAVVGSAEEVAKVAYQIVHELGATGENPLANRIGLAHDIGGGKDSDIPKDAAGIEMANSIAVTTNKQAINNAPGTEIKTLNQSNSQVNFPNFYDKHIDITCASIGIPPNVAMSLYNDSFSASRAALKDWEHTLKVDRKRMTMQFYQRVYNFWLEVMILTNKIQAPGYLQAKMKGNMDVLNAYRKCRFIGSPVPHIDPLKEVNAERAKLGPNGAHIPLTTVEAATENLNSGEAENNIEQFAEELKSTDKVGIKPIVQKPKDESKKKKKSQGQ